MMFAQKGLFGSETEKSHLHVRPWLLLRYQTFPHGGRQTDRQTDRDKYSLSKSGKKRCEKFQN